MFIRKSIHHYVVDVGDLEELEATAVEVETATAGTIRLIAAYCPPNRDLLAADLDMVLFSSRCAAILAGDLNAKHPSWHSRRQNPKGTFLREYADESELIVDGPLETTHVSTAGTSDVLDIAILKDVSLAYSLEVVDDLDSDHQPVLLSLGNGARETDTIEMTTTCWTAFSDRLQESLPNVPVIRCEAELEEAVEVLTDLIQKAIEATSRKHTTVYRHNQLPVEIVDLIREKRRARRLAQRTMHPVDRARYNQLALQVREALQQRRNDSWDAKLERLEEDDHSLWRMTKILRNKSTPMPPIHSVNGVVYTDNDKAEAFADTLELQCSPNFDEDLDLDHVERIESNVRRQLRLKRQRPPLRPASMRELDEALKRLKPRKAPGPDGVGNKALKNLPTRAKAHLLAIINAIIRLQHFPSRWKCADVIVLQKPGKAARFPQNYRPISLLPTMGKIAERVILTRLQEEVEELNLVPNEQFGFRPRHSTTQQVLRLVEHVTGNFNMHKSTGAIFLDVSKAFDKVWHEGLLAKLLDSNIHLDLTKLVASFLRSRSFRVKLGSTRSSERRMEAGVPQGSLLSPLLYSLFTMDMPKTDGTCLALYADDTAVCTSSKQPWLISQRLQTAADRLEEWFSKWRIGVNPEKSTAVFFTKRFQRPQDEIRMFDRRIPWGDETKYLGVVLDRRLTWRSHTNHCSNKAKSALGSLQCLFHRRSKLSAETKVRLYKLIIRPMMTYASPCWGYAAMTHIRKLQVVQNRCLRQAIGAPWYVRNLQIHRDLGMEQIAEFIRDGAAKLFDSLEEHPNPLAREIAQEYDQFALLTHKRPKMVLLP